MTLNEIKKVLREEHRHVVATSNGGNELTPIQKFQIYEQVLMNLLEEGLITGAQFSKWINVY